MIVGEVFEYGMWPNRIITGPGAGSMDNTVLFNTFPSFYATTSTLSQVGIANRGLGNEGLVFRAGRNYEGYLYARSIGGANVTVYLQNYISSEVS